MIYVWPDQLSSEFFLTMVFVKAQVGPPLIGHPTGEFTVQYFDEQGNLLIRSKGTRAWRCNNPGNLKRSPYSMSKNRRAIGFAGDTTDEYAVYPDYQTGHDALIVMLKGNIYGPLTLISASKRYVASDQGHIGKVIEKTGLDPNQTIKSLSEQEFEKYWKAIESIEGWKSGDGDFIEKWFISGVRKQKGVIIEYLINQSGNNTWITKSNAIDFALQGKLHAVLVHHKDGYYLRPNHGLRPFERLALLKGVGDEMVDLFSPCDFSGV